MWIPVCTISVIVLLFRGSSALYQNDIPDAACAEGETPCGFECCPYSNATCCMKTNTCCRQGAVCLGRLDICLGQSEDSPTPTLYTEKAAALKDVNICPRGTTSCFGRCCPLPRAVCCPDRMTCCPAGYVCARDVCRRRENISTHFLDFVFQTSSEVDPSYSAMEQPVVKKHPISLNQDIPDSTCAEAETPCGFECCPYSNATCCMETNTCCRQGAVCLGRLDICLGLSEDSPTPTLYTEKAAALKDVNVCPRGTTSCYGGCCPLPRAVCCPDRVTCCPAGYVCAGNVCRRRENISTHFLDFVFQTSSEVGLSYSPMNKRP